MHSVAMQVLCAKYEYLRISIHRSATPGRLTDFEEELSRFTHDGSVDALSVSVMIGNADGATVVGVAVADMVARTLSACQFTDDLQLCALESVLVQIGAKECVLPKVLCLCCCMLCIHTTPTSLLHMCAGCK